MTKKVQTKKEISVSADKTISFQLTITSTQAKKEYQNILKKAAAHIEIKGFRKGNAPLDLVEKEISLSKVYEDIIQNLLPKKYSDIITKNKLKPIIKPQVILKNPPLALEKNWLFEVKTCQKPNMSLKPYKTSLKKINLKKYKNQDEHNQEILKLLSSKTTVTIPKILLDTQTKERMVQLVDSSSQVGLTVDQYLKSKKTDLKEYQQNLQNNLTREWKINLSLDKIATKAKIEIKPEDLKKAMPSQKTSDQQTNFIYYLLRQQKTLDHLRLVK